MRKLRTIDAAYQELKQLDPGTCISKNYIRACVKCKKLPSVAVGTKRLIDISDLMAMVDREIQGGGCV